MIQQPKKGVLTDSKGRSVNKKGYLIDKQGNIIDQNGKEIFKKEQLNVDGEPPKIFNFTKFNTDRIKGNFEIDK